MKEAIHFRNDYPYLVGLMQPDDDPSLGVPLSVDLADYLSAKAATHVFNKGFVRPSDFFQKAGLHDVLVVAYRKDYPREDFKSLKRRANDLVIVLRRELS